MTLAPNKKLFLSVVSSEFLACRNLLAGDLKRPNLEVAVQEEIEKVVSGGSTLEKLDDYIQHCDAVIHLIGKATGAVPREPALSALLARYSDFGTRLPPLADLLTRPQPGFSYAQWEAYLALYHRRPLYVYRPTDFELDALDVPRNVGFKYSASDAESQRAHYRRICDLGQDRGHFRNEERLSSAVLRDLVEILPRLEARLDVPSTRLHHTAERLVGRDDELTRLDAAWNDVSQNVVVVRAFGGMGKTSLVATWMAELALKNWRGAERVFDWSFYSQGTRDQGEATAEPFIAAALAAFGDPDPKEGSAWDRGARLAHLVARSRCLLVLDGLEPLQYPPGPMAGQLKDAGVQTLLKGLAAKNAGLCVVTTREKVPDIQQHYGRSADDFPLPPLSDLAGAALLHHAGATRAGAKAIEPDDRELQKASREVRGHGLTLHLLGQYLRLVEDGDILKRDTVRLADADHEYQNDATRPYGHAFKAMEAYEKWFTGAGEFGQRQLAVLRLLGLFDRPAPKDCLEALRAQPIIAGLTEPLVGLGGRDWKLTLSRLEEINLVTVNGAESSGELLSLDAHPLLREYFAQRVREGQPEAWRAAHQRLYEHLCSSTHEGDTPTLEDLQPLYQAVAHGCHAGLQQEACNEVYSARILQRGRKFYSINKLGAFGSDLGAVACFFEPAWGRVSPKLSEALQGWLLGVAAFDLWALGRLTEALEPMRAGLPIAVRREDWETAAIRASNLSQLELTLGEVAAAERDAEQSVAYGDRSDDAFQRSSKRTAHADALHQAGRRPEAETLFREAERIHAEDDPKYPLLYSVQGFLYCDLLLAAPERAAWRAVIRSSLVLDHAELIDCCTRVSQRAKRMFDWRLPSDSLLDIALDHLTLGRAALYEAVLAGSPASACRPSIDAAVSGLRRAGTQHYLPRGLLTRAWLRVRAGACTGSDSAQTDLDEAWEIAERGPMPLFLADIHLHRARLFFREAKYPWESPQHDLAEARRLINKHGYHRRDEELADAEAAIDSRGTH